MTQEEDSWQLESFTLSDGFCLTKQGETYQNSSRLGEKSRNREGQSLL